MKSRIGQSGNPDLLRRNAEKISLKNEAGPPEILAGGLDTPYASVLNDQLRLPSRLFFAEASV